MRDEDRFDEIAINCAKFMTQMMAQFPGSEPQLTQILTDSVGGLIAIAAKEPAIAIEKVCLRLKNFPWAEVRSAHYMAVNRVTDEVGNLRKMGPLKGKPK